MANNTSDLDNPISDRELIYQLKQISANLQWLSEAEYPFQVVYWDNIDIKNFDGNFLLQQGQYTPETKIEIQQFDSFFAIAIKKEPWHDEKEQAEVLKYQTLVDFMSSNLTDLKVYLLGEVEINAYILGKTSAEAIAGLVTTIVRT